MKTWTENGYEMSEQDGQVYVNERGIKMIFVEWANVGENVVPVCWIPAVKDEVGE